MVNVLGLSYSIEYHHHIDIVGQKALLTLMRYSPIKGTGQDEGDCIGTLNTPNPSMLRKNEASLRAFLRLRISSAWMRLGVQSAKKLKFRTDILENPSRKDVRKESMKEPKVVVSCISCRP